MRKVIAPLIVADPSVRFGRPVIRGTRVAVETVLAEIAGGMTVAEVMREYQLTRRQLRAALEYARRRIDEERYVAA